MKHYICVEEHGITYICGDYKAAGRAGGKGEVVVQEACSVSRDGDLPGIFGGWSEEYGLEGKQIALVMGRGLSFLSVRLPKAGKGALRRMACNELAARGKGGPGCLMAVDLQKLPGGPYVWAMVYYMEQKGLEPYVKAMEQAGMIHAGTFLTPDCTAAAGRRMCRRGSSLIIDVETEGVGIFAIEGGHCLAWRSSPLKAGRFCEREAVDLLFDEIAEQAAGMQEQLDEDGRMFGPERAVVVGNCFPDLDRAFACLEKRLDMPCVGEVIHTSGKEACVTAGALAAVVAGSRTGRRLLKLSCGQDGVEGGRFAGAYGAAPRGGMLFLLVNLILAVGTGVYLNVRRSQVNEELGRLQASMRDNGFYEDYQKALLLDRQVSWEEEQARAEGAVKEEARGYLDRTDLEAFTFSMEPGMKVEAVMFDKASLTLEMLISQGHPAQVPPLVERVRAAGVFKHVGHGYWERKEDNGADRVYASIHAVLDEGEQDEDQ